MYLIFLRELVSGMALPIDGAGELIFPLLLSASLLASLGSGGPFLINGIFPFVPLFIASMFLRILWLCGLHQIQLIGLRRDCNSLNIARIERSMKNISGWCYMC